MLGAAIVGDDRPLRAQARQWTGLGAGAGNGQRLDFGKAQQHPLPARAFPRVLRHGQQRVGQSALSLHKARRRPVVARLAANAA